MPVFECSVYTSTAGKGLIKPLKCMHAQQKRHQQMQVTDSDNGEGEDDLDAPTGSLTPSLSSEISKAKKRQNFTWRQISVLEQVFETDSHPRMV